MAMSIHTTRSKRATKLILAGLKQDWTEIWEEIPDETFLKNWKGYEKPYSCISSCSRNTPNLESCLFQSSSSMWDLLLLRSAGSHSLNGATQVWKAQTGYHIFRTHRLSTLTRVSGQAILSSWSLRRKQSCLVVCQKNNAARKYLTLNRLTVSSCWRDCEHK